MKKYKSILILALASSAAPLWGQLSVADLNTPYTVDFSGTVAGVTNGAWTASANVQSPALAGGVDSRGIVFGRVGWGGSQAGAVYKRETLANPPVQDSVGWYVDSTNRRGTGASTALVMHSQIGDTEFTDRTRAFSLVVQNNSGSTINQWAADYVIDLYKVSALANRNVTMSFSYQVVSDPASLDAGNWVGNLSNTVTSMGIDSADFAAESWLVADRSTTISASVADGDYLVLRYWADTGSNTNETPYLAFDSISVTAIPESSQISLAVGLVALLAIWLRRRKS